jgi:integrase
MLISLESLALTRSRWQQTRKAVNTYRAYDYAWRKFESWCQQANCSAYPALPEMVELFTVWCLEQRGYRFATVGIFLHAIADRHRSAGQAQIVEPAAALLRCARRQWTEERRARKALTVDLLRAMSSKLATQRPIDTRNRALLVLGFAAGWRASELAALETTQVAFEGDVLVLWQARSKTDQQGYGREVRIPRGAVPETCPLGLLQAWLRIRGDEPGPIFLRMNRSGRIEKRSIRRQRINGIVKETLKTIGEDASGYGSHSLRAGMVTTAAELGASELAIMHRTGHRNLQMVLDYVRSRQAFRMDPLRGVL